MLIVGISYDALSTQSELTRYSNNRGLSFPIAAYERSIVADGYRITAQSSAVGIDANGIIQLRKGYGLQNRNEWQGWVNTLVG